MGLCVSGFLADIILNKVDQRINDLFSKHISTYVRFVDDIVSSVEESVIPQVIQEMNQSYPCLKYTVETANQEGVLIYLDMQLKIEGTKIVNRHYVKVTQTDRTVNFNSAQPAHVKTAVLKNEVKRVYGNSSKEEDFQDEVPRIKAKYIKNGYPNKMVNKLVNLNWIKKGKNSFKLEKIVFLPYIPGIFERTKNVLKTYQITVVAKKQTSLFDMYKYTGCSA